MTTAVRAAALDAIRRKPATWRKGQAIFNALVLRWPDAVEPLRGTSLDPFHVDGRIEGFIHAVEEAIADNYKPPVGPRE